MSRHIPTTLATFAAAVLIGWMWAALIVRALS